MIRKRKEDAHWLRSGIVIEVQDDNKNMFTIKCGGNLDLFWFAEGKEDQFVFNIGKNNEFFPYLNNLYAEIQEKDDPYYSTFKDGVFTWISEDASPEDEANNLTIEKQEDKFVLSFNKNINNFCYFSPMCAICFCNNGSRHPDIEILFMRLFNTLKEYEEEPNNN